jgi:lipooligosaccharide transport system permease protein
VVYLLPLWNGVELCRSLASGPLRWWSFSLHLLSLAALLAGGYVTARVVYRRTLHA